MKNKLIILIFVASLVVFISIFYINFSLLILEKEEIVAILIVGDKAGFDVNSTALTFGMITAGSSSSRNLIIENNYDFPIKVEFNVKGDIKRFLVFEKVVYLDSGENKTVSIGTIDPVNEEYGNYSGKVIVVTKRNLYG